ncbi:MAG: cytochrome C oxidase Cbb3, partial [Gammaproteobacteria bacterium]|nr:cytochrome C oxidase Cbb3 [Gammaproteobacteria bacterium]
CHMPGGTGNQALGAPNLTNNIWLYGGSPRAIKETLAKGRNGRMPAHGEFLGKAKVHILTAYVYSLSHKSD